MATETHTGAAGAAPTGSGPLLELRGVTKRFGAVQALGGADFHVHTGEVVALVGDNGAGKSTLIKTVSGVGPMDEGTMYFDGQEVHVRTPHDSAVLGVAVVYQDLALCDNLDVVQNLFLGREQRTGVVLDEPSMEQAARETLARLSVRTLKSVRQL